MQTAHRRCVDNCLSNGENSHNDKWTESIAVRNKPFIKNAKALMGGMALGRKVLESGEPFQLKEAQYPYNAHSGPKKSDIDAENAYFWE